MGPSKSSALVWHLLAFRNGADGRIQSDVCLSTEEAEVVQQDDDSRWWQQHMIKLRNTTSFTAGILQLSSYQEGLTSYRAREYERSLPPPPGGWDVGVVIRTKGMYHHHFHRLVKQLQHFNNNGTIRLHLFVTPTEPRTLERLMELYPEVWVGPNRAVPINIEEETFTGWLRSSPPCPAYESPNPTADTSYCSEDHLTMYQATDVGITTALSTCNYCSHILVTDVDNTYKMDFFLKTIRADRDVVITVFRDKKGKLIWPSINRNHLSLGSIMFKREVFTTMGAKYADADFLGVNGFTPEMRRMGWFADLDLHMVEALLARYDGRVTIEGIWGPELWDACVIHDMSSVEDGNPLEEFVRQYDHGPVLVKPPHYFHLYHKHFHRYRGTNFTFLEVGVQSGGSILMWKHYFGPSMHYIGIDINPRALQFATEGVEIIIGDQSSREFWRSFKASHPHIDVLLDDGGHTMQQQKVTYEEMYGHVVANGIFACEDLHTSYWRGFMGNDKPSRPLPKGMETFVDYSKRFIDWLHGDLFDDPEMNNPLVSKSLVGIHYYRSVVFLEKGIADYSNDQKWGDFEIPYEAMDYDGKKYDWSQLFLKWVH